MELPEGSAFVVAIQRSGIKVLPHIVNAVVLTSALSAANLDIIRSSRIIYALASKRQLPKYSSKSIIMDYLTSLWHSVAHFAIGIHDC